MTCSFERADKTHVAKSYYFSYVHLGMCSVNVSLLQCNYAEFNFHGIFELFALE